MRTERITIGGIPAILWGEPSDKVYIHVHGKMSRKEYAEEFARLADEKDWQTLSFDLPEHGERPVGTPRCDVWQGMRDLNAVADYAFTAWRTVALFACSLGAYFSLNTYADRPFARCLFQSPIVDMEWLVKHMMLWSGVDEDRLRTEGEIGTPIDTLRWDYYQYILAHPAERWPHPTSILYGGKDNLQPLESIRSFADRFHCGLTVAENSEHPFMAPVDGPIVTAWLAEHI